MGMSFDAVGFGQVSLIEEESELLRYGNEFPKVLNTKSFCSIDIKQAQKEAAKAPHCPLEIRASESDNKMGVEYFTENKEQIRQDLLKYGAIWFRGFDLMKGVAGHREMYEALELEPCLDPLHSSGLRKFSSERDALYEEVGIFVFADYRKNFARSNFAFLSTGQQAITQRPLHRFALRIDHKTYSCVCCIRLLPKGNRRWRSFLGC